MAFRRLSPHLTFPSDHGQTSVCRLGPSEVARVDRGLGMQPRPCCPSAHVLGIMPSLRAPIVVQHANQLVKPKKKKSKEAQKQGQNQAINHVIPPPQKAVAFSLVAVVFVYFGAPSVVFVYTR